MALFAATKSPPYYGGRPLAHVPPLQSWSQVNRLLLLYIGQCTVSNQTGCSLEADVETKSPKKRNTWSTFKNGATKVIGNYAEYT